MNLNPRLVIIIALIGAIFLMTGVVSAQSPSADEPKDMAEATELQNDTVIEGLKEGYDVESYSDEVSVGNTQTKTEDEEITISSPAQVHVPGMGIDMSGTVSPGVNEVSVFVSNRGDAFHLTSIDVDPVDNTYEKTNFNPRGDADSVARDILSQPGVYSYFVADHADIEEVDNNNPDRNVFGDDGIDAFDLFTSATEHQALRVAQPSLSAEFEGLTGSLGVRRGTHRTAQVRCCSY